MNSSFFKSTDEETVLDTVESTDSELIEDVLFTSDITGDSRTEIITAQLIKDSSILQNLRGYGYEMAVTSLTVQSGERDVQADILTITSEGIFNQLGRKIIDQENAPHGYGVNLIDHTLPESNLPTILIEVAILDSQGTPVSDDLTIYWHPGTATFEATNTFGAPGTY